LLTAKLTHMEENPIHYVYHVTFSDGYETAFFSIETEIGWLDQRGRIEYARAIRDDLHAIIGFKPGDEIHCFQMTVGENSVSVWVNGGKGNSYTVYYGGDYRFNLRKTDRWEYSSLRKGNTIDTRVVNEVVKRMDALK
ncbi:MAG TPA: hypothetical protein VEY06_00455, partial [Flavisolibacter sp.]|nr:hypothetical protein [Flavisolibacter sp.]